MLDMRLGASDGDSGEVCIRWCWCWITTHVSLWFDSACDVSVPGSQRSRRWSPRLLSCLMRLVGDFFAANYPRYRVWSEDRRSHKSGKYILNTCTWHATMGLLVPKRYHYDSITLNRPRQVGNRFRPIDNVKAKDLNVCGWDSGTRSD